MINKKNRLVNSSINKKCSAHFYQLAEEVGFSILDIGARTEKTSSNPGIAGDFKFISKGCDYYGYEPDKEEINKLNATTNLHWKSQNYIPEALGELEGEFKLNLHAQPGFSSKLNAKKDQFELFSRSMYLKEKEKQILVKVNTLDNSLTDSKIPNPCFMKIDIQGMELEVFKGATNFLKNHCLGIRVEVYFHQIYENQPLFTDVDAYLRNVGFLPFQFAELHSWRRDSTFKFPFIDHRSKIGFSEGQLMHADVVYLKDPSKLEKADLLQQRIRLALISLSYRHYDLAHQIFSSLASKYPKYLKSATYLEKLAKSDGKLYILDRWFYWFKKGLSRLK